MSFYKYYFFLFFALYTITLSGQSNKDQIENLYNSILEKRLNNNLTGIEDSIDSLLILSEKSSSKSHQFLSRILIASIYHNNREFDLAEPLLIKNRLELKSIEPSTLKDSLLIDTYGAFAEFYYCEEDYPNSVKNYIQSLKISKK